MGQAGYIQVRNWKRFQHYKGRRPAWIKLYLDLLHDDDYLALSASDRGVLMGIWMLASVTGDGRLNADSVTLGRQLSVRRVNLEPLIQAGFITICASKVPHDVLEQNKRQRQKEIVVLTNNEVEEPAPPLEAAPPPSFIVDLPKINSTNGNGSDPLGQLTAVLDTDDRGAEQLRRIVATRGLSEQHLHRCRERILEVRPRSPIAYAIQYLRKVAA